MFINFYNRDQDDQYTDQIQIPTSFVPRVGETIDLKTPVGHYPLGTKFLVHDVSYELDGEGMSPYVNCHPVSSAANTRNARRIILKRNGWLKVD